MLIKTLNLLPPEFAHNLAIFYLKHGFFVGSNNSKNEYPSTALENTVFNLKFNNPVGLSAGFDKNAECLNNLSKFGFGFIEVGTVTVKSQPGNSKPRIFRLKEDYAIINRLGFNNKGIDYLYSNILSFNEKKNNETENNGKKNINLPIGINIGKNKETKDPIDDYVKLFKKVSNICSYIVLNISSPNTVGLRDLQKPDILANLVGEIQKINNKKIPLLIKIAPDIKDEEKTDIVNIAIKYSISGIILTNTTINCRENLKSKNRFENGGLSGKPLFELSTKILGDFYKQSKGKIPLIGCGGISSAKDAYLKIRNGASLLQLYTALIYNGFGLVHKINCELEKMLISDGYTNIQQAIGSSF